MKVKTAVIDDLMPLYNFYDEVIEHQKQDEYGAGWTKDVYPSLEDLKEKIENDLFFIGTDQDHIVCAAALSLQEDIQYKKGKWLRKLDDGEIGVLHLFAVHPDCRGKGVSQGFLKQILLEAEKHVKSIHLDLVKGNLAALKAYEKAGFRCVGQIEVFYEDTGNILVELMEYDFENRI